MKRVAIFTEGQGELILVRHLLLQSYNANEISFDCFELYANVTHPVAYSYKPQNPTTYFQIINVGGDEKVLSVILERQERLIQQGYEIIGLRDLYSDIYLKKSPVINEEVSNLIISSIRQYIESNPNGAFISIYFAIMEMEAWFLSMHNLFVKINPLLSPEYIYQNLGLNLIEINPETNFFHPAEQIDAIFLLSGIRYDKSRHQIESLVSKIDSNDILNATENGRCNSFYLFLEKITNLQ